MVPYAHFFGHRGFFRPPFFAVLFAATPTALIFLVAWNSGLRASFGVTAAFALALAFDGALDAMIESGPGIMLLYPFSEERLAFAWRRLHTPPLRFSRLSLPRVQVLAQ